MATKADYEVTEIGVFAPFPFALEELGPGEVGFFSAAIKSVHDTKVGDTVTEAKRLATEMLPGFKEVKPMVFAGVFPTDSDKYGELRDALERLHLNDAAFQFEPDTPRRSASASAAGSSASCTWRSSRSGSSASTTST